MQQKIRSFVRFDLCNFDMTPWVSPGAHSDSPQAGGDHEQNDKYIYDLYSVVNHQGGLSSGHYTNYTMNTVAQECGLSSRGALRRFFVLLLNVAWGARVAALFVAVVSACAVVFHVALCFTGQWFCFNDDDVRPVEPDHVVSADAYILFYRRRSLSPRNLINTLV